MVDYNQTDSPDFGETFLDSGTSTAYQTPTSSHPRNYSNPSKSRKECGKELLLMSQEHRSYQSPADLLSVDAPLSESFSTINCQVTHGIPYEEAAISAMGKRPHIGVKEEAHEYMVTNKHILNGYRINYTTWGMTFWSLFQMHNETVNVWTHLIGFVIALIAFLIMCYSKAVSDPDVAHESARHLLYLFQDINQEGYELPQLDFGYVQSQRAEFGVFMATMENYLRADQIEQGEYEQRWYLDYKSAEAVNTWPLIAYLITAMFCLGFSTICHLCFVKSARVSKIVANLDYWGIAVLFLGSTYPFISYKYACGPYIFWRYIFISIITCFTLACMYLTVKSAFMKPINRAILFTAFGVSVLIPTVGLTLWHDPLYTLDPNLMPYSWTVLFYLVGMIIYITKVPERFSKTGRFDYIGSSHQIFHCLVLCGVAVTFYDSYMVYLDRLDFTCPAS